MGSHGESMLQMVGELSELTSWRIAHGCEGRSTGTIRGGRAGADRTEPSDSFASGVGLRGGASSAVDVRNDGRCGLRSRARRVRDADGVSRAGGLRTATYR